MQQISAEWMGQQAVCLCKEGGPRVPCCDGWYAQAATQINISSNFYLLQW